MNSGTSLSPLERDHARRVILLEQEPRQRRRQDLGAFELRAPRRPAPILHGRARVADDIEPRIGLLHVSLDAEPVAPRVQPPIQVPQIVPRLVIPVIAELDAEPVKRAVVQPAQEPLHHIPRLEIQPLQRRQHLRVEPLGQGLSGWWA